MVHPRYFSSINIARPNPCLVLRKHYITVVYSRCTQGLYSKCTQNVLILKAKIRHSTVYSYSYSKCLSTSWVHFEYTFRFFCWFPHTIGKFQPCVSLFCVPHLARKRRRNTQWLHTLIYDIQLIMLRAWSWKPSARAISDACETWLSVCDGLLRHSRVSYNLYRTFRGAYMLSEELQKSTGRARKWVEMG